MNPETVIQAKIMAYLKEQEILVWRISDNFLMAGFPDLLVCYEGRFIALEVKTKTGKPTHQQEFIMNHINNKKGIAEIVRSVSDVKRIINRVKAISETSS